MVACSVPLGCGPTAQNPQDASGSIHIVENGETFPVRSMRSARLSMCRIFHGYAMTTATPAFAIAAEGLKPGGSRVQSSRFTPSKPSGAACSEMTRAIRQPFADDGSAKGFGYQPVFSSRQSASRAARGVKTEAPGGPLFSVWCDPK